MIRQITNKNEKEQHTKLNNDHIELFNAAIAEFENSVSKKVPAKT